MHFNSWVPTDLIKGGIMWAIVTKHLEAFCYLLIVYFITFSQFTIYTSSQNILKPLFKIVTPCNRVIPFIYFFIYFCFVINHVLYS